MILVGILLISASLRLIELSTIPSGFSWDEAAIGYNGYGILTSRRDEWLERLPISFRSFGDYKAPVAIYLNTISSAIFGLSVWSTRFPMAMAGIVTTLMSYLLGTVIFKSKRIGLVSALMTAVSPWNIHFSRIAFDSGIAVAFSAVGFWLFFKGLRQDSWKKLLYWLVSGSFFVVSIYAYHSTKMFIPLALVVLAIWFRSHLISNWKITTISIIASIVMLLPLANEMMFGNAAERFFMTSTFTQASESEHPIQLIGSQFLSHFSPSFLLFGGGDDNYRHANGVFGVLSYLEVIGIILGLLFLMHSTFVMLKTTDRSKNGIFTDHNRRIVLIWTLVLLALVPSAVSEGAPSSNRAHGVVPFIQIIASVGIVTFIQSMTNHLKTKHSKIVEWILYAILLVFVLIQTGLYVTSYRTIYRTVAGDDFQEGLLQAMQVSRQYESQVDRVVLTSAPGQVYIYALFVKQLTPFQWQHGALSNYTFKEIDWAVDQNLSNTLLIGSPEEIPIEEADFLIESWEGKSLFVGVITEKIDADEDSQ